MAYLYCRSSVGSSSSSDSQRSELTEYCGTESIDIFKVYQASGSGKNGDNLYELKNFFLDNKDGITHFIVLDCTRLTRSKEEGLNFINRIVDQGIIFISVNDRVDSRSPDWIERASEALAYSEREYNMIRERTMRGYLRYTRQKLSALELPFGFNDLARVEKNPEEYPILLNILALRHNGIIPKFISTHLNSKGYTYRGEPWDRKIILKIIRKNRKTKEKVSKVIEEGVDDRFHPYMRKFHKDIEPE